MGWDEFWEAATTAEKESEVQVSKRRKHVKTVNEERCDREWHNRQQSTMQCGRKKRPLLFGSVYKKAQCLAQSFSFALSL